VAQALREARASLARPSRPLTAECRSLFREADSCGAARPSSSYGMEQLSFVHDTFGSTRGSSSGSTRSGSSRSQIRSRESKTPSASDLCSVPELEEPFLELPPELRADILTLDDNGEEVHSSSPTGGCALEFDVEDPGFEGEEYDSGKAADDLALCMDVPPPGSDEDSAAEVHGQRLNHASKKRPAAGGQDQPQLRRKSSSSRLSRHSGDKALRKASETPPQSSQLRLAAEELENFERAESLEAEKLSAATDRICTLAAALREGSIDDGDGQAARLLRTVLKLMERKSEHLVVLRLARCMLALLRIADVLKQVGHRGVEAAYLNAARALFKLSKEATLDAAFREEGLLEPLLELLGNGLPYGETSTELRIFVVGVLKNASNNVENQKFLAKRGAPAALVALVNPAGKNRLGGPQEAQLLIQVTALLRNLASTAKRQLHLIELDALGALASCSASFFKYGELQVNIARVVGKLSQHDAACEAMEANPTAVRQLVASLREHAASPALVLRLVFALGNLTATSDELRQLFVETCDGAALLSMLLQRYWQHDRRLSQARPQCSATKDADGSADDTVPTGPLDSSECESVLVKLVRLVANISITPSIGMQVAAQPGIIDPLLDMLGSKRMSDHEELVLSATAAATNLLYYDSPNNLLFTAENKQLLCRLLRPMLLESYNVEALVEAARALGNLSRHRDARQWISELRIDEALAILLAHSDRDLVFYSCGALVNMAADPTVGGRLCREAALPTKLVALLCDAPEADTELLLVAVKVLSNLCLKNEDEELWPQDTVRDARTGVQRALDLAAASREKSEELLLDLAQKLLEMLPVEDEN